MKTSYSKKNAADPKKSHEKPSTTGSSKKNTDPFKVQSSLLLAKFLNIGYYLVAPLLIGVFFGLIIDNYLGTEPLFTLSLIFLGMIATFYNMAKIKKEVEEDQKNKQP